MARNKEGKQIRVSCHFCEALIDPPIREYKINKSDFYVCHVCNRNKENIDSLHAEGMILVWKMNVAGAWTGYDPRTPTKEDIVSGERAREILRAGISKMGLN